MGSARKTVLPRNQVRELADLDEAGKVDGASPLQRFRYILLPQLSGVIALTIEVPSTVVMAGAVILTVPVIALFFLTERLLVEGLTAGAEKG